MPRPDPRFLARSAPFAWILLLAAVPCLLLPARAGACLSPPGADLWTLTSEADRILLVEVEELRRSRLDPSRLHIPRQVAVEMASLVSTDLGLIVDETLPEAPSSPIFVATARVLDNLSPSPDISLGSRQKIVLGDWGPPVFPGHAVLFFLHRTPLGYRLLPYGNAALYFADDSDLRDLESVIASALALQENDHVEAPAEWRTLALSLPGSRGHAWASDSDAPFDRAVVAEALVLFPDDPTTDLGLLNRLGGFDSPELDRLAVAWADALLAHHEDHGMLYPAIRITVQRWSLRRGIETSRIRDLSGEFQADSETLRQRWNTLRDRLELPYVDTATILERLHVNQQRYREIMESIRSFERSVGWE